MVRHMRALGGGIAVAAICVAAVVGTNGSGWLLALAAVALLGGGAWSAYDFTRARRLHDEYQTFAHSHGWEYLARSFEYDSRFASFPFGEGGARRQESVVRGEFNGQRCATFAQVYEIARERGAPATVHAYQVTMAELPVALPRIDIVPQSLPATLAKALGGRDIDVESHEFNVRWRVLCDDARYGHAVIDPRMIERLLYSDVEGMAVRIEGGAVYVWTAGRQGAHDLARRLAVVSGIARRIPAHVIREFTELGYKVRHGDAATRPLTGPAWAIEPGALTSRRYTGIGVDADGDGIEDWRQLG
ncbi:hypothetical protein ACNI3K_01940 [Demequina sp. SO4-13]|uniref:hypothetical protein n=1 Tax=Demequina sp. SO4-13 TaxID=3401027 RepID=UPI003AF5821B